MRLRNKESNAADLEKFKKIYDITEIKKEY